MKLCRDCGNRNPDRSRFCRVCGSGNLVSGSAPAEGPAGRAGEALPAPPRISRKRLIWGISIASAAVVVGVSLAVVMLLLGRGGDKGTDGGSAVRLALTHPGNGDSFTFDPDASGGASLDVELEVTGEFEAVEIYLDGELADRILQEPYECRLNDVTEGSHAIEARAIDAAGGELASDEVLVAVWAEAEEEEAARGGQGERLEELQAGREFANATMEYYTNDAWAFSIACPRGWVRSKEDTAYGHRTKWRSQDGGMYFLVDASNLYPGDEDPVANAYAQDASFKANTPGYVKYGISRETFKGRQECRWELSYPSGEDDFHPGQTIRKFDFFVNGDRHGYAILFAAQPGVYELELRGVIDCILETFEPDTG